MRWQKRLEKHEQADGIKLLELVGAKVYVLGTRRKRGDHQGTMQTPGIPDVLAFLPTPPMLEDGSWKAVWFEFKRAKGGKLSEAQEEFQTYCRAASVDHVVAHGSGAVADYLKKGGWLKLT